MWYRWTKVVRADIPPVYRQWFEELSEPVVAHMAGTPLVAGQHAMGIMPPEAKPHASKWLRERESMKERRQDISEAIEVAILVLVAVEAMPIAISAITHIL